MIRAIVAGVAAACVAGGAWAQQAGLRHIDTFRDWNAYTVAEAGGRACYVATQPKESKPQGVNRDPIWLLVTHRPYKKVANEVSIYIGYPFRTDSKAQVDIDGQGFTLFTNADTAWAETAEEDARLVDAMRRGTRLRVRGVSARGTETEDQFSLLGFTAAMKAIGDACGVR